MPRPGPRRRGARRSPRPARPSRTLRPLLASGNPLRDRRGPGRAPRHGRAAAMSSFEAGGGRARRPAAVQGAFGRGTELRPSALPRGRTGRPATLGVRVLLRSAGSAEGITQAAAGRGARRTSLGRARCRDAVQPRRSRRPRSRGHHPRDALAPRAPCPMMPGQGGAEALRGHSVPRRGRVPPRRPWPRARPHPPRRGPHR